MPSLRLKHLCQGLIKLLCGTSKEYGSTESVNWQRFVYQPTKQTKSTDEVIELKQSLPEELQKLVIDYVHGYCPPKLQRWSYKHTGRHALPCPTWEKGDTAYYCADWENQTWTKCRICRIKPSSLNIVEIESIDGQHAVWKRRRKRDGFELRPVRDSWRKGKIVTFKHKNHGWMAGKINEVSSKFVGDSHTIDIQYTCPETGRLNTYQNLPIPKENSEMACVKIEWYKGMPIEYLTRNNEGSVRVWRQGKITEENHIKIEYDIVTKDARGKIEGIATITVPILASKMRLLLRKQNPTRIQPITSKKPNTGDLRKSKSTSRQCQRMREMLDTISEREEEESQCHDLEFTAAEMRRLADLIRDKYQERLAELYQTN